MKKGKQRRRTGVGTACRLLDAVEDRELYDQFLLWGDAVLQDFEDAFFRNRPVSVGALIRLDAPLRAGQSHGKGFVGLAAVKLR